MKSFGKIICILLAGLILAHSNYLLCYYTLYNVNVTGLTEACCEKKVVNCNAHCYLDKKMNEGNSEGNNGLSAEMKLKISEFVVKNDDSFLNFQITKKVYHDNNISIPSSFHGEIEHPPKI